MEAREAAGSAGLVSQMLADATDARLVALVRHGQPAAFEAIRDRYRQSILSFCLHLLGDPEEAADAVEHTFTVVYAAITSTDGPMVLRLWLFTTARNRCHSLRQFRRELSAAELVEAGSVGLAAQMRRPEDLRRLLVQMRDLHDDQRAALVLGELGALSQTEIGIALGLPPRKLHALASQARESLAATRGADGVVCSEIQRRRNLAAVLPAAAASSAFKGRVLTGLTAGAIALLGTAGTIGLSHALQARGTGTPHPMAETALPVPGTALRAPRSGLVPPGGLVPVPASVLVGPSHLVARAGIFALDQTRPITGALEGQACWPATRSPDSRGALTGRPGARPPTNEW